MIHCIFNIQSIFFEINWNTFQWNGILTKLQRGFKRLTAALASRARSQSFYINSANGFSYKIKTQHKGVAYRYKLICKTALSEIQPDIKVMFENSFSNFETQIKKIKNFELIHYPNREKTTEILIK